MSSSNSLVLAPVGVRGMTVLERDKFLRTYSIPVLKVKEESIGKISPIFKCYLLKIDNFKPIQQSEDVEFKKHIHLHPSKISQWTDFDKQHREALEDLGINENNLFFKEVELGYNNWNIDTIFKAVLPDNEEMVSSYSQIGHIIHLNLKSHLLDYRYLIGEVFLDKLKTCRTVVNKCDVIDNTFRNFSMEVLAGAKDFLVNVKENNCNFQFDFSKVYWNPRLGMEHERIIGFLRPGDVLFDVFCGVGPFAVPAARRKCLVYANDLNPESYKWLNVNAEKNRVKKELLLTFNKDGKDFICENFKQFIEDCCNSDILEPSNKIHVTMNLPAMAVEFLKYFYNLIEDKKLKDKFKFDITVYVYCFVGEGDLKDLTKKLVSDNFGVDMSSHITNVFHVRKVAPKKDMMRVTLKLTKDILFGQNNLDCEPPSKKLCVENK